VAGFLLMDVDFVVIDFLLFFVSCFNFVAMAAHDFQQCLLVMVADFLVVLEFQKHCAHLF
jgi:hypothetical protein